MVVLRYLREAPILPVSHFEAKTSLRTPETAFGGDFLLFRGRGRCLSSWRLPALSRIGLWNYHFKAALQPPVLPTLHPPRFPSRSHTPSPLPPSRPEARSKRITG